MGNILLGRHGKIIYPVDRGKRRDKSHALHIHDRLDADLAELDTHLLECACDAIGKRPSQHSPVEYLPLFPQAEQGHFLLNISKTEQTAERLAEHSRQRTPGHAPLKGQDKEQVQDHIERGADDQEDQRGAAVPQSPERIGKEIIYEGKDQPAENDPQIHSRGTDNILRHLKEDKQRMGKDQQKDCDCRGKPKPADHRCTDLPFQLRVFLRPILGAHQDPRAHAHTADKQDHHIHDRPRSPHRRQRIIPHKLTHDHRIRCIIRQLEQIAQYERDRKSGKLGDDLPLRHIRRHILKSSHNKIQHTPALL